MPSQLAPSPRNASNFYFLPRDASLCIARTMLSQDVRPSEKFNPMSRAQQRHRQTTEDRQTDGRTDGLCHKANIT